MCSCAEPEPIATALQNADAVFTGRVLEIEKPLIQRSLTYPVRVTFEVSESWKGADFKIAQVSTASNGVSCGYPDFEENENFLVFARQTESGLETDLCSQTQPLKNAQVELAALYGIQTPLRPEGTTGFNAHVSTWLTMTAAVLLAALFFALWKKIL